MKYQSKRLFIALLFLIGVLITISLPENYHLKFSAGPLHIDRVINPLSINVNLFGFQIQRNFTTQFGLDLSGGTHVTLEADMKNVESKDRISALESAKSVIERRVNFLGVSEPLVQTAVARDSYRIIVELPGITQTERAMSVIGQTAELEFREFRDDIASNSATPSSVFEMTKPTNLTGKDLKRAQVVYSSTDGKPQVAVEFTEEGGKKFADLTKRLIGKFLPIFLDGQLVSSPTVQQEITGGNGVINGGFTPEAAKQLAVQLNAGALPVPIHPVEQRVVEASLGQDSVTKSVMAGVIGLLLVAGFMIAQYGVLGLIAVFGLLTYGLVTFASFRAIPVTLTLPGIAGFILSMGMAVDSNILIFERYKEEKRAGKPWKIAMEHAFQKAWESIRDANITTMITCLILFNPFNWQFLPTSGLVRGFAVTLFLGVIVGLFTGIIVTRTFIRVLYRERETK